MKSVQDHYPGEGQEVRDDPDLNERVRVSRNDLGEGHSPFPVVQGLETGQKQEEPLEKSRSDL